MIEISVLGPSFKRCHGEQRQHSFADVIKVEILVEPFAFEDDRLVNVAIFIVDVETPVTSQNGIFKLRDAF